MDLRHAVCTLVFLWHIAASQGQYHEHFLTKIPNYKAAIVKKQWEDWMNDGSLIFTCPRWCHPAGKYIDEAVYKVGKLRGLQKCDLFFPRKSSKTLKEICTFLWGFSKAGFFDWTGKTKTKRNAQLHSVTIQLNGKNSINFDLQSSLRGQFWFWFQNGDVKKALSYDEATELVDKEINYQHWPGNPDLPAIQRFKNSVVRMNAIMDMQTKNIRPIELGSDEQRAFKPLLNLYILFWVAEDILPQDSDIIRYEKLRTLRKPGKTPLDDEEYKTQLIRQTGRIPHLGEYITAQLALYKDSGPKKIGPDFTGFINEGRTSELPFSLKGGLVQQRVVFGMNMTSSLVQASKIKAISGKLQTFIPKTPAPKKAFKVYPRNTRLHGTICNTGSHYMRKRKGKGSTAIQNAKRPRT